MQKAKTKRKNKEAKELRKITLVNWNSLLHLLSQTIRGS